MSSRYANNESINRIRKIREEFNYKSMDVVVEFMLDNFDYSLFVKQDKQPTKAQLREQEAIHRNIVYWNARLEEINKALKW